LGTSDCVTPIKTAGRPISLRPGSPDCPLESGQQSMNRAVSAAQIVG
jgi:hypothetical protein